MVFISPRFIVPFSPRRGPCFYLGASSPSFALTFLSSVFCYRSLPLPLLSLHRSLHVLTFYSVDSTRCPRPRSAWRRHTNFSKHKPLRTGQTLTQRGSAHPFLGTRNGAREGRNMANEQGRTGPRVSNFRARAKVSHCPSCGYLAPQLDAIGRQHSRHPSTL